MGTEASPGKVSCATTWTKVRVQSLLGKEESVGWVSVQEGIPPRGNTQQGRHRSIS